MITKTVTYKDTEENIIFEEVHIIAPSGHFERDGHPQGWHIQVGSTDSADNYTEVDDGVSHSVPELPDVVIVEDESEETEEEADDES